MTKTVLCIDCPGGEPDCFTYGCHIEKKDSFLKTANRIGKLVSEKNRAYGDSFNKSAEFLKILYPKGIYPSQYGDMLGIIRVFDKMMRIANRKDAFGENPWDDITGYGILKSSEESE